MSQQNLSKRPRLKKQEMEPRPRLKKKEKAEPRKQRSIDMEKDENHLNFRQKNFVAEYASSGNATEAAIEAGYSKNGAAVTGSQLLRNPNVWKAIERAQARRRQRIELSGDAVVATGPSDPALPTPGNQATLLAKLAELLVPKAPERLEVSGGLLSVQVSAADLESARALVESTLRPAPVLVEAAKVAEPAKSGEGEEEEK